MRAGVLPETTRVVTVGPEPGCAGTVSGPCSSTMWALVPPMPNDDTAARRGCSVCGHWPACVGTNSRVPDASMLGFHFSKLRFGAIVPCCRVRTVLMNPAMPAAASRWPMLVLTAPSAHGVSPLP